MKKYNLSIILMVLGLSYLTAQRNEQPQSAKVIATDAGMLQRMIENYHCCPRTIDEQYYRDIAYLFLRNLDPLHIYFTKEEVERLNDYSAIKDALEARNHSYVEEAITLYRSSLNRALENATASLQKPFDFTVAENIYLVYDSAGYAIDLKELQQRMFLAIKFKTLNRLAESVLLDSTLALKPVAEREPKEREIAGKIRLRRINRLLESKWGFENLVTLLFDDAVVKANDPHSDFIPEMVEQRKASFANGSAVSFGLKLAENYVGDVVVLGLVPNSSAWKSGIINKDDVLISMQWEDQPIIDLEGADLDEVEAYFAEKKYRKMTLTVRKADGQLKSANLSKGHFYESAGGVQSFILDGPVKIAYVIMPSFYGDWESVYGSSCAREMSKDLEKLQFEVDGLIIDMRYNGGGSLDEANQMAGIFIDEGPLGFRKQRGGFSTEMKDPMLGTMYQEPMIVMVNNESASATEYVAAALQDYNRAIIVGSPTFGKATAQRYLPVDTSIHRTDMNRGNYNSKAKDFMKITVAKLYRVTGYNNQLLGVQPDIFLPTVFDSIHSREQHMKNVLSLDTLKRNTVYEPFAPLPIRELRTKSDERISATPAFQLVQKGITLYNEKRKVERKPMPLQYDKFMELSKKYLESGRKLVKEIYSDSTKIYNVTNWVFVKPERAPDPLEVEANNVVLDRISKDVYIHEAYFIMKDWLELKKASR